MRELKIKRAPSSEISALDKDMKKNRKLASAIGLNINKLEAELNYVKSEAYLKALIRKLSTEKKPIETTVATATETSTATKKAEKTEIANAKETTEKTETKGTTDKTDTTNTTDKTETDKK